MSVDRASFVALMVDMAIADFRAPEQALLPAFELLDTDGDGSVTQVTPNPQTLTYSPKGLGF